MKFKKTAILILFAVMCVAIGLFAAGCASGGAQYSPETWEGPCVEFVITQNDPTAGTEDEGVTYKNSSNSIIYYFQKLEEGETLQIAPPDVYSGVDIIRPGYTLTGWFRTRSFEDGVPVYSDEFDFESDVLDKNEKLTLYAKWERNLKMFYSVCYKDENGKTVSLGTYTANEGAKFNDARRFPKNMSDQTKTAIGENGEKVSLGTYTAIYDKDGNYLYYDKEDNPWDPNFQFPKCEEDTTVEVFVHWLPGVYDKLIYDKEDILEDLSRDNVYARGGAYLMDDIDMEGASFGGWRNSGDNSIFSGEFNGNGKTLSNFTLSPMTSADGLTYDDELGGNNILAVALFGILRGGRVQNVSFEDVTVDINTTFSRINRIVVAPIAVKMEDFYSILISGGVRGSLIKDVSFSGTYKLTNLPGGITEGNDDKLHIETENLYYLFDNEGSGANSEAEGANSLTFTKEAVLPARMTLYIKSKKEY